MKVKMRQCLKCETLLSNSSKVCTKCGSNELVNGFYSDEAKKGVTYNKHQNLIISKQSDSNIRSCPTCGAGITIKNGFGGECSVCVDEISSFGGGSLYLDYMDEFE